MIQQLNSKELKFVQMFGMNCLEQMQKTSICRHLVFVRIFGRICGHIAVLTDSCCLCSLQESPASRGDLFFPCYPSYTVVSNQAKLLQKQLARKETNTLLHKSFICTISSSRNVRLLSFIYLLVPFPCIFLGLSLAL